MRTKVIDSETETKILNAATTVFHRRGIHGARMQEIADMAKVSKSMLHYYFTDKDKLFEKVFDQTMKNIFPKINSVLSSNLPLFQKIAVFMNTYTDILLEHHYSADFVISEMITNSDVVLDKMITSAGFDLTKFCNQLDYEHKRGTIIKTDVRMLFLNMTSLCVFPFVVIEVQLKRFNMSREEYFLFLEARKSVITEMITNSIAKNKAPFGKNSGEKILS